MLRTSASMEWGSRDLPLQVLGKEIIHGKHKPKHTPSTPNRAALFHPYLTTDRVLVQLIWKYQLSRYNEVQDSVKSTSPTKAPQPPERSTLVIPTL